MQVATQDSAQEVTPRSRARVRTHALDAKALESLRTACVARNWGDRDLSREAHISESTAWKILNGRPVSAETLRKVAQAIDDSRPDKAIMRLLAGEVE